MDTNKEKNTAPKQIDNEALENVSGGKLDHNGEDAQTVCPKCNKAHNATEPCPHCNPTPKFI